VEQRDTIRWGLIGVAALTLALGAFARPAQATLLRPLTLDDLIRKADRVLLAEVVGARCVGERGRIYTHTEVRVQEQLKGKGRPAGSTVVVRQMGGELDGVVMGIAGTPELKVGAAYLLFLDEDDSGLTYHYVVGFSQGVYRLDAKREGLTRPVLGAAVQWAGRGKPADDHYRLRLVRERLAGGQL